MKCQDIMTPNPRVCPASASAQEAAQILKEDDIGSVPIVSDESQKLVGILTDRDLCLAVVAEGLHPAEVKVAECMTRNPIACKPQDDLEKAEALMKEHQIRRIPIVDETGSCVGIIAQADIALRERPEEVHETVQAISRPERRKAA